MKYETSGAQLEIPEGYSAAPSLEYRRGDLSVVVETSPEGTPRDWAVSVAEATRGAQLGYELLELSDRAAFGADGVVLRQRYRNGAVEVYGALHFFRARGELWSIGCAGPADQSAACDAVLAHVVETFEPEAG